MAVVCPSCERVHFDTNTAVRPTHCAGCGHDFADPPVPLSPVRPPSSAGASKTFLFAGVAVLCAAGGLLLSGVAERNEYESATATVKASSASKQVEWQRRSSGEWVRYESARATEASYVVDGKRYPISPGDKWKDKQQFTVWHRTDAPERATETRPFGKLVAAVGLMAVGVFLFGLAFGVFGGLIEATVESIKVAIPKEPDPPAAPPRWFTVDNERRRG